MRVSFVLNSRMPTERAAGIQTARMCEELQALSCDVTLYHPRRRQVNPELDGESVHSYYGLEESVDVRSLPFFDPYPVVDRVGMSLGRPILVGANLSFPLIALVALLRERPDFVVTRDWPVAVTCILAGLPTVFSAHNVDSVGFSARARQAFDRLGTHDSLKLVVCNSRATAEGMIDIGIPERKVMSYPNGVDLSVYEPDQSRNAARRAVGLPIDRRLVVYTGSLIEQKGAHLLARASEHLEGDVLLVGGSQDEISAVEALVEEEELSDVRIVGSVPPTEVPAYQFAADVLALPPLAGDYDRRHQPEFTSPLKMFEYMAARRPFVASDLPALREVLDDERNALLVEPGSHEAFGEAVDRLGRDGDLVDRLVENAWADVQEYTWESRARAVKEALENICSSRERVVNPD